MSNCIKDLSHSKAFELLSSVEREILEKKKVTIKYEKGEAIIKQGTLANSMLFINKGMSKLFVEGTQKK
jgi:signal-transduction protein with cAMP-binding, CBS, and nucleotidyltransferase domain